MKIFDIHTHIGAWNNSIYENITATVDDMLFDQEKENICQSVVMPSDQKENMALLERLKRSVSGRFYFFPWIDPKEPGIMDFLLKNAAQIAGLKFSASYDRIRGVTDPSYAIFVNYAISADIPILIHCGRWTEMAGFHYALELAGLHPGLRVICAHMGGIDPALQIAAQDMVLELGLKNVWFDTSAVQNKETIMRGITLLGSDRFCFGSDYPLYSVREAIDVIMGLDIAPEIKEQILYSNAKAVLKRHGTN